MSPDACLGHRMAADGVLDDLSLARSELMAETDHERLKAASFLALVQKISGKKAITGLPRATACVSQSLTTLYGRWERAVRKLTRQPIEQSMAAWRKRVRDAANQTAFIASYEAGVDRALAHLGLVSSRCFFYRDEPKLQIMVETQDSGRYLLEAAEEGLRVIGRLRTKPIRIAIDKLADGNISRDFRRAPASLRAVKRSLIELVDSVETQRRGELVERYVACGLTSAEARRHADSLLVGLEELTVDEVDIALRVKSTVRMAPSGKIRLLESLFVLRKGRWVLENEQVVEHNQ